MGLEMDAHVAVYGNVRTERVFCEGCEGYAIVLDGELQCCGAALSETPTEIRQMSQPHGRRKPLSAARKAQILEAQNSQCLYCDVLLDDYVFCRGKIRKVKCVWDHMAPYVHTLDSHHENYAAACQFCNGWKASKVFETISEVRKYVSTKWAKEQQKLQEMRERGLRKPLSD